MYPFHTMTINQNCCIGLYKNGVCRYHAQITRKRIGPCDASRETILTVSLSSVNGIISIRDIQAIAVHCCQQLCHDGFAPKSAQIEIMGFRWADQLSLVPDNGIAMLAEYEASQLSQNGYSDACLQTKVTKDGVVRIIQARKHSKMVQATVLPGQSVLAQNWQAI